MLKKNGGNGGQVKKRRGKENGETKTSAFFLFLFLMWKKVKDRARSMYWVADLGHCLVCNHVFISFPWNFFLGEKIKISSPIKKNLHCGDLIDESHIRQNREIYETEQNLLREVFT